jgi:hypothetical protein
MRRRPWRDFLGQDPALPTYDRKFESKTEADRWEERLARHIDHLVRRQYALKKRLKSRIRRGLTGPLTRDELNFITHAMYPPPWPYEGPPPWPHMDWPKYPH